MIDMQKCSDAIRRLRPGSQYSIYFDDPTKEQNVTNIEYVDDGEGGLDTHETEETLPAVAPNAVRYGDVWAVFHDDTIPPTVAEFDAAVAAGPPLSETQANAIRRIDADVDAIYGAVIGNRQSEYDAAESDATAYKAANYGGTVPANVQSWATAKKWTAKQAADDILATAANWRAAQADIRANRLARKEDVRAAANPAAVDTVLATWSAYVAAKRAALGA